MLLIRGYRYGLSLTHDPDQAEDLLQDAWVSVLKARGPREIGYLFASIRSRFVDRYRRKSIELVEPLPPDELERIADDERGWNPEIHLDREGPRLRPGVHACIEALNAAREGAGEFLARSRSVA